MLVGPVHSICFPGTVARTLDAMGSNTSTDDRCVKVPSRSMVGADAFEAHQPWFAASAVSISVAHFGSILLRKDRQPGCWCDLFECFVVAMVMGHPVASRCGKG